MRFAVFAAFYLGVVGSAATQPASKTILISSGDGYGTTQCLASGDRCGQLVADSLCNREGYPRAAQFQLAAPGEMTASTGRDLPSSQAFVITCAR